MRTLALIVCLVACALGDEDKKDKPKHHSPFLVLNEPIAKFHMGYPSGLGLAVFNFDKNIKLSAKGVRNAMIDFENKKLMKSNLEFAGYVKTGDDLKHVVEKTVGYLKKKVAYIKEQIEDKHDDVVDYIVKKLYEKYGDKLPHLKEQILMKIKEVVGMKLREALAPKIADIIKGKLKEKLLAFREKLMEMKKEMKEGDMEEMKKAMEKHEHKRDVDDEKHEDKHEEFKNYLKEKVRYLVKYILDEKLKLKAKIAHEIIAKLESKEKMPVSVLVGVLGSLKVKCKDEGAYLLYYGRKPGRRELMSKSYYGRISKAYVKVSGCDYDDKH